MRPVLKLAFSFLFLSILISAGYFIPQTSNYFLNAKQEDPKEALFYQSLGDSRVQCMLCPRKCVILSGKRGFCGVRENKGGVLYSLVYAKPVTLTIHDPIEKKPLFHFFPTSLTFSVATAGCNLRCKFCQNWEISQAKPEELRYAYLEPYALVEKAREQGRFIIAYTYSEPTIFYEYMLETAKLARAQGIKNCMHSNGFINPEPLRALCKYLDAANIDLKGFTDDYYVDLTEGALSPVLESLKILKEEGVHLEITTLLVPGQNDDELSLMRMCQWIKDNLGLEVPVHFSRFFPTYRLIHLEPTPFETLEKARTIAVSCGLKYVYIGNVPGSQAENTNCPSCGRIVIRRAGYAVSEVNITHGKCDFCGEEIAGVWE